MSDFVQVCESAARAGAAQLGSWQQRFNPTAKGRNDLVTEADFASQQAIHDHIHERFPDHCFVGEERMELPMAANSGSEWRWIVDPLDGTLNYVHQMPSWSVSVALEHEGCIVAGAVYDPCLDEMYSAGAESPAQLNGRPISSSGCDVFSDALTIVSLPSAIVPSSPEIADLNRLLCAARSVRRLGSAALNLCYVASGRADAYWATSLNLWDLAAGWLILERGGAVLRHTSGQAFNPAEPRLVAAATADLADQIVAVLRGDRDREEADRNRTPSP
jgi:myo-inositol-1(or 4)-monophosphatase